MPRHRSYDRIPLPPKPQSFLNWLLTKLLLISVVGALGYFGYRYVLTDRLNEEIRRQVEAKFRDHYRSLSVTVESARRVEGQGIEIGGVTIRESDRTSEPPLLHVEQILIWCDCSLQTLATAELEVKQLVLRNARLNVVRRKNGTWNVEQLLPPPSFSDCRPPISIEDCTVDLSDESHPEQAHSQWRDLQLTLTPDAKAGEALGLAPADARSAIRIGGSMSGEHFRRVDVVGVADLDSKRWYLQGEVEQLQFTRAMREGLPRELAAELAPVASVSGNTHLKFEVDNLSDLAQPVRFQVQGTISEGRIDDDRLPLPITELSAELFADNAGLRIEDFSARLGAAKINLSLRLDGYENTSPWLLRLEAEQLALDERMAVALPENIQKLWKQLSPSGIASGKVKLLHEQGLWKPSGHIKLEQLSFLYDKFPYRMFDGQADLTLSNELLNIEGTAMAGNSGVRFQGEVRNPGPEWSGWCQAQSMEPLPIDDQLLTALTPGLREVVQSMNVRGAVQLTGRLDRQPGSRSAPHAQMNVELCDCSIAYRLFPYPIDHVSGTLRGDDGVWSFSGLKGSRGGAQIQASGNFGPDGERGPLLALEFKCQDVPLDATLHSALNAAQQKVWNDVRPQGSLDVLEVNLTYRPHSRQFAVDVTGHKVQRRGASGAAGGLDRQWPVRVEPVWFPYAMDFTSGTVKYQNGLVELSKLRGVHDKARFELDGSCRWLPEGAWSFNLDRITADRLQLDHDLLAALPKDAGAALAKARFSGALGMTGSMKFSGEQQNSASATHPLPGLPSLAGNWDLAFDIEDGRLGGDIAADHIQGGLRVVGGLAPGRWFSQGEIKLDSLFVKDLQITRVLGPFYVDSQKLLLGSWAEREQKRNLPRQLTAQLCEGLLTTDAAINLDEEGRFQLACALDQADLAKIVQETGGSAEGISGKTFATMQMTGTTRGKHTWKGGGNVRLREADLYEVPLMVAMLKLLSIQQPSETAFSSSDIDFRIQGDDVILDRIDLSGDAVTLKGRGQLFEQKQIDLLFYTQVGRQNFAAIRPLIQEASPNFLLIEVTGTIDRPNVKKTAFPALNETLRDLFPDLARGEPLEARSQPALLFPRGGLFRR